MSDEFTDGPDPYWESERVNDRDEWDLHVRAVEDEDRDRLNRDAGEGPCKDSSLLAWGAHLLAQKEKREH
jgi:hypothetical protein